jgi:U3 small nucleolar RNA-associated protein 15
MEYEAGDYQKLQIKQYPARTTRETAEGKYWKQFKAPVVAKQVGSSRPPSSCSSWARC